MGKILGALLILEIFVFGLLGVFIGPRDSNKVRAGKKCDAQREVFKKDKKVLGVF